MPRKFSGHDFLKQLISRSLSATIIIHLELSVKTSRFVGDQLSVVDMRRQKKVIFKAGRPQHVYEKNSNGFVLFYRVIDYLFTLTVFSVMCKKHNVRNESFCIMPNHLHSQSYFESAKSMASFLWDFHKAFNKDYELSDGKPAINLHGSTPKISRKKERSCDIYIDNNPVAGRLSATAEAYRWNLMAYKDDEHPFSTKIIRSQASRSMRRALKLVDHLHSKDCWLNYTVLKSLFEGLNLNEQRQLEDYIITKYNPVDYSLKATLYSSHGDELKAKASTTGEEHDLIESWEDHSVYRDLSSVYNSDDYAFEKMGKKAVVAIARKMHARFPGKVKQIMQFLHITDNVADK